MLIHTQCIGNELWGGFCCMRRAYIMYIAMVNGQVDIGE
jgi:hypothetical protein